MLVFEVVEKIAGVTTFCINCFFFFTNSTFLAEFEKSRLIMVISSRIFETIVSNCPRYTFLITRPTNQIYVYLLFKGRSYMIKHKNSFEFKSFEFWRQNYYVFWVFSSINLQQIISQQRI